jgi:hypothetical protein
MPSSARSAGAENESREAEISNAASFLLGIRSLHEKNDGFEVTKRRPS